MALTLLSPKDKLHGIEGAILFRFFNAMGFSLPRVSLLKAMTRKDRKGSSSVTGSEEGFVLIVSLMVMLLLSLQGLAFLSASATESTIASNKVRVVQAFAITEAGIEHARRELMTANINVILSSNPPLIPFTAGGQNVSFAGGTYSVAVRNNTTTTGTIPADPGGANNDTDDILVLTSTGTVGKANSLIEAVVKKPAAGTPGAIGAVTTNGPTKTNGTIIIDGRDHDMDGYVIDEMGTYGVFTASTYIQTGNSKVGGTEHTEDETRIDYAPAKPGDPSVIAENYSGTMAATPDEVMGYSTNGTVMSMAQSGTNGSQYVTDPLSLTYPLSGVTYVDLTCGEEWVAADIEGSGVLIVHNACTDAVIKNLNTGTFKGLLIADDIVHIHTTIIGAVVSLATGPSSGNVIGNGIGEVLYSRQALANALGVVPQSYSILSWREIGS